MNDHISNKKRAYWKFVDWISRRVFFLAVAPWTLPVFGGLLISTNLLPQGSPILVLVGVVLIFISTIPLGLNAIRIQSVEEEEDRIDAQERQCLDLVAELLPLIPTSNAGGRTERCRIRDQAMHRITETLAAKIYSNIPGVRTVVFVFGTTDDGHAAVSPASHSGRGSEPSVYVSPSSRFHEFRELANGVSETRTMTGITDRSYTSYVSSAISKEDQAYGVLTVDTPEDWTFTRRDERNMLVLAHLLAAFFSAATRGQHAQNGT